MKYLILLVLLVGCSQPEDPEKDRLRSEIVKLNGLLSAEKTPQVEMVEKMEKFSVQHKQELGKLQGRIDQLNKELVEKEVSPALVGLQVKLKELDKRDVDLNAEVHKLQSWCRQLEDNKSNCGDTPPPLKGRGFSVHWEQFSNLLPPRRNCPFLF